MFLLTLQSDKEKRNPLSKTQRQPSCVPPERNPFKVHGPKDKDPEKKRVQTAEGDEKRKDRESQPSPKADGGESYQKENVKQEAAGVEKERESKIMSSDTYRGKQLPVGMKVKKRVSDEESPKGNNMEKETDKVKDKSRESNSGSGGPVHPEKINPALQDPHKDEHKNQTDRKTHVELTDPSIKKALAKSLPDSGTQAIKNSESTRKQTSESPTQSTESSRAKNHQEDDDDDDDDVLLVSVKPATKKSPQTSAVQKTLTAFPGFQPASKVKGQQDDPRGLRNMLTSQLQQKKVSVIIYLFICPKQHPL